MALSPRVLALLSNFVFYRLDRHLVVDLHLVPFDYSRPRKEAQAMPLIGSGQFDSASQRMSQQKLSPLIMQADSLHRRRNDLRPRRRGSFRVRDAARSFLRVHPTRHLAVASAH